MGLLCFSLTDASVEIHQCVLWGRLGSAVHARIVVWHAFLSSECLGARCRTLICGCVFGLVWLGSIAGCSGLSAG